MDKLFLESQTKLIVSSYKKLLGKDLIPPSGSSDELVRALYEAPFIVASATNDEDPILNYGNKKALSLWELSWDEFIQMPGRKTAEPMEREERQNFLESVRKNGYVDNYQGIRISKTGKRFKIHQATVWNLLDNQGVYQGQAATFKDFTYL